MLREKIRNAILSAMQKGTDLSATLPPAVQGYAKIKDARFKDGGDGRLLVLLDGEIKITNEQIQTLSKQVKQRVAAQYFRATVEEFWRGGRAPRCRDREPGKARLSASVIFTPARRVIHPR